MKQLYRWMRDLHLYFGLFISPTVLVFAVSVIFLVHAWIPLAGSEPAIRTANGVAIPDGVERLSGREQVDALRGTLDSLGVGGEVNFIRRVPQEHRLVIPVIVPGRETMVDLNTESHTATITRRETGVWSGIVYLHKMPGQHNAAIRANSTFLRWWKRLADATVYLVMFLSLSGIYLWMVLRAERRIGWVMIGAGACSFLGLVYAVIA